MVLDVEKVDEECNQVTSPLTLTLTLTLTLMDEECNQVMSPLTLTLTLMDEEYDQVMSQMGFRGTYGSDHTVDTGSLRRRIQCRWYNCTQLVSRAV